MFRLALALTLYSTMPTVKPETPLVVVAHRGASADAPENTLPAFELAWKQGADAIEGDFHLTSDKEIVCIHDDTTRRFRGKKRTVRKSTLAQLKVLDAGSWRGEEFADTRVPTLTEVIATIPSGKKLYIEIKSSSKIIPHLLKVLDSSPLESEQIVIICFSQRVVKKLKQLRPNLKVCWLTDLRHRNKSGLSPNPEQIIQTLKKISADGVSTLAHKDLDEKFVQSIRTAGFEFHVWTEDDPRRANELVQHGVQSITTNVPAKILGSR